MSETKFTKMQQAAIDIRNSNILVSAAAGSGKTAVLVQRIIDRVLADENSIDIDRILVMTFTKAAAAQMKERILDAINEKRSLAPHDKNLNKQYALVHNAYIMTIDSFCMSVVKNHFEEIGLSPDFRMADEGEIELIKQDVLAEVLESFYENGGEKFLEMTEVFATNKTDKALESLVLSLYDYATSYPAPTEWLKSCMTENNSWLIDYVDYVKSDLKNCRKVLDEAGDICRMEYGPAPYLANIESDIVLLDSVIEFDSYEQLYEKCTNNASYSFSRMASVRKPKEGTASEEELLERDRLKNKVSTMRDKCKKTISSIIDSVLSMSPDDIKLGSKQMHSPICELIELTMAFYKAFDEKKRDKNVVDFDDIEHMCLSILKNGADTVAVEYRDYFEEIYVDEYQDSNYVQEEILNLISRSENEEGNVFMVGDVKQSIYGFRNAKPEIFIDKYERFDEYVDNSNPRDVKVNLSHNFRSRGTVLNAVNNVFKKIMTKNLGGIEYDDAAALHVGREYIETDCDYSTELNLMISDDEVSNREAEALMVANRIKSLMNGFMVEDKDAEGGMRPLKYSDIVILLRTAKGWDNVFHDVLEGQDIPVFVTSTTGYFQALEVKTLINFLKVIDNPLQDIPFAAVLMSVIGNFTEEEVAMIRGAFKNGYLYESFIQYKNTNAENVLAKKIQRFTELLEYYRKKSEYTAVADILTEIIDGDYGKIIKAMPGGKKKMANLNMLLKKAMEYGKTSYKGIFQFNRYIEAIRKYEIDYGEANISDENDNTVRIMSIHKSKGLEFPVCFVSGISKKFNMMDIRASVLTDGKYGIATDIINPERRLKSKSLFKQTVARKKQEEIIAEELRLLYVAMTRAKEKLILTGVVKDEDTIKDSLITIDKANSYLDMYICASADGIVEEINLSYINTSDLVDELIEENVHAKVSRSRLIAVIEGRDIGDCESEKADTMDKEDANEDAIIINSSSENVAIDIERIETRLNYKYPYEDKGAVKLSVSELKHRSEAIKEDEAAEDSEVTVYLYEDSYENTNGDAYKDVHENESEPVELAGNKEKNKEASKINTAALHGTAVHRIFEIWDYNRPTDMKSVKQFLEYVNEEKLIEDDLFSTINPYEIYDFVNSDISKRMAEAFKNNELYREQPFVICDDALDAESMLVQGIIDAYFIEDGKIVLVDYKTDWNTSEEKLLNDHKIQLEYYGKALSRLLHLELKEKIIYSTYLKRGVVIV